MNNEIEDINEDVRFFFMWIYHKRVNFKNLKQASKNYRVELLKINATLEYLHDRKLLNKKGRLFYSDFKKILKEWDINV